MKRNGKPQKLRGATYIRMSSGKQEDSPERQQADIDYIPEYKTATVAGEYADHAISGTASDNRPDFQRMMRDADDGRFDVLFCSELSRLTREEPIDTLNHLSRLSSAGVRLVTKLEGEINFSDLPGLLMLIIKAHGNRDESIKIAHRSSNAMYLAAKRGEWPSGPPYAFKKKFRDAERRKGGYLVLGDKQEIKIVKLIFRLYLEQDTSLSGVALELNRRGYVTPRGKPWHSGLVRNILIRPAYKGKAAFNRMKRGKFKTVSGGQVVDTDGKVSVKPESDWVIHECPAIVSERDWVAAQKKLAARALRTTPWAGGGDFLLSGMLWCGNCGGPMRGAKRGKGKITSYFCGHYNDYGSQHCSHNSIREDLLLGYLVGTIRDDMLSPDCFDELRASAKRELGRKTDDSTADAVKHLRKRLRGLDRDIKAGVAEMSRTPDDLYQLVVDRIRGLRDDRDQVAARLEEAESMAERPAGDAEQDVERVIGRLMKLRENITSATPAVAREALGACIERVDLSFTGRGDEKHSRSRFTRGVAHFFVHA